MAFSLPVEPIIEMLGLEVLKMGGNEMQVRCPFCGGEMSINLRDGVYHCFHCADDSKNTGILDLYGRLQYGEPLQPGVNTRRLYKRLLRDMGQPVTPYHYTPPVQEKSYELLPAADEKLDAVYRGLLSLPFLSLSKPHRANLQKRGLGEKEISAAPYRSCPEPTLLLQQNAAAESVTAWYDKNNIDSMRKSNTTLRCMKRAELICGFIVGEALSEMLILPQNVPGFFKLGNRWCFKYTQGMLIPTVSVDGKIIGIQVRRDIPGKNGLRYMTLSSKGLDGGPNVHISRIHVSMKPGHKVSAKTSVFLTEGPLKADVIRSLLWAEGKRDVAVIAVQGVNNLKDLPDILKWMADQGVKKVSLALDMDRFCNIHVAKAQVSMEREIAEAGLQCGSLTWDAEYASEKRCELFALCESYCIPFTLSQNPYADIFNMTRKLHEKGIPCNIRVCEDGSLLKENWRDDTKGFDDYLLYRRKQKQK